MKKQTFFAMILILFVAVSAFSQSQDSDRPTPLISNEVTKNVPEGDGGNQYFYSFVAGQGTLTIMAEVKGFTMSQLVEFRLFEKNGADEIGSYEYVQTDTKGNMTRKVVNIKIDKRRTILLRVTPGERLQYHFRLSGSAISNDQPKTDEKADRPMNSGKAESDKSIKVPSKGILQIKMKNGSTKEIDLSLVREILIESEIQ